MATGGGGAAVSAFLLFLLVAVVVCAPPPHSGAAAAGGGWKVGGRTAIPDVGENEEVQDLGRFAVLEYNRRLGPGGGAVDRRLVFGGVVRAERQVVSGVKYYLRIVAAAAAASCEDPAGPGSGSGHPFDAVVVVKAWLGSKQLLSFAPSSSKSLRYYRDQKKMREEE